MVVTMSTKTDVQAVLEQLDGEIAEAERNVAALRVERRGAEAILARLPHTGQESPRIDSDRAAPSTPRRRGFTGNASLVAEVLHMAGADGMDLQAIVAATAKSGTALDYEQVRAAVAYLRKQETAERISRGVWRLITPTDTDSPEDTGLSVVPDSRQESGATRDGEHAAHHVAHAL